MRNSPIHVVENGNNAAQRLQILIQRVVELLDIGFGVVGGYFGVEVGEVRRDFGQEIVAQTLGKLFADTLVDATVHLLVGEGRVLAGRERQQQVDGIFQSRPILLFVIFGGQLRDERKIFEEMTIVIQTE